MPVGKALEMPRVPPLQSTTHNYVPELRRPCPCVGSAVLPRPTVLLPPPDTGSPGRTDGVRPRHPTALRFRQETPGWGDRHCEVKRALRLGEKHSA